MGNMDELQYLNILYVEDEIETLELYSEFLSYYVNGVETSTSSGEALEMFKRKKPDVVLTDIDMPGINGVTLATEIRKLDKEVRIIMLTAHTDPKYMIPSIELDISKYLVKPISKSALLDALKKCAHELKGENDSIVFLDEDFTFNLENKELLHGKEHIRLQKKSTQILEYLILHKNSVVTYESISELLWGDELVSLNAIRCQIRSLRKKLPVDVVENISGIGYKINLSQKKQ